MAPQIRKPAEMRNGAPLGSENPIRMLGLLLALLSAAVLLSACAGSPVEANASQPAGDEPGVAQSAPEDLLRIDRQGAVEVSVVPRSLEPGPGGTLEFEVSMNTHSVDLSMDLAALSTLETDTGLVLEPRDWSGGGGGHHVRGLLRFVADPTKGALEGAQRLILTIREVDAPQRVFEWALEASP